MNQSQLEKLATVGIIAAEFGHTLPMLTQRGMTMFCSIESDLEEGKQYEELKTEFKEGIDTIKLMGHICVSIENYVRLGGVDTLAYDANESLEKMISLLRPMYCDVVNLIPRLGNDLPKISLTDGFLGLCVFNALKNSKYADAKNFEYRTEPAGEFVKVSFVDDGWGIGPEYLEKIVDPFVSFKTGGVGLGLATTKRIMDLCGGKLEITSPVKDGRGTAVSLYIPAAK